jgi:hypothetical protein
VDAVRVDDDVLCVFNATPLEKYESYRRCLDQWSRCDEGPDFAPTVYNLIDSLASFLEINRYSPHNGTQPKFLIDMLPEVYGGAADEMLLRLISRKGIGGPRCESMLARVEERGSAYLPELNAFYVHDFKMMHAAEDATRFLHHACQGLPHRINGNAGSRSPYKNKIDAFYAHVVEHAVAYFGSRVLYPARSPHPTDDPLALSRSALDKTAQTAVRTDDETSESTAREWGFRMGSQIYDAYLAGKVLPSGLRRLFLAHLEEPGLARRVCAAVISRLRRAQLAHE